jgi:hypothetical protein
VSRPWLNAARNVIAGLLVGYGFASFFCFIALVLMWSKKAPSQPNEVLGLIYRHNEHGSYTYFSAFQATTCWLMFTTSIPLAIAGIFIAPRKNIMGTVRWYAASFNWDQDDPKGLLKWVALGSAATTPFLVFFVGPHLIRGLNAVGFVMNLGS